MSFFPYWLLDFEVVTLISNFIVSVITFVVVFFVTFSIFRR